MTHARSSRLATFALVAAALAPACTNASGHESGGDSTFDAALPSPPPIDAAPAPSDAGADAPDALASCLALGTNWSDLYRDFFGPGPNAANCASCHATSSGNQGASSIWVCNDTQDACYAGMLNPVDTGYVIVQPGDPNASHLLRKLRRPGNTVAEPPAMPITPQTYVFSDCDMARITAWIQAGATNK